MGRPTEARQRERAPSPLDLELADLAKAIAHPVRVQIIRTLMAQGQGCFCGDLVAVVGLAQSTVSHHLKALREAGLVTAHEEGTAVCYCVDRDRVERFSQILIELNQLGL